MMWMPSLGPSTLSEHPLSEGTSHQGKAPHSPHGFLNIVTTATPMDAMVKWVVTCGVFDTTPHKTAPSPHPDPILPTILYINLWFLTCQYSSFAVSSVSYLCLWSVNICVTFCIFSWPNCIVLYRKLPLNSQLDIGSFQRNPQKLYLKWI